ncbi:sugar phosphate nucleotidyltransferase [Fictibacillus sp. NRS-1165]|uniref:sugar phosphate nucleotidyltransferase n=1 Tax=Fictibacillus sp. NRS-1165 TaxID=3144463 RepID=UPI003D25DAEA
MRVVSLILASGKGSRLYPLSTEDKPKQFLRLYNDRTMIENTMFRFLPYVDEVYGVTLERYRKWIQSRIPRMFYEPDRKESAFSVLYGLREIKEIENDCIVIQTPSDHYIDVDPSFFLALKESIVHARKGKIVAIGVKPSSPDPNYGYMKKRQNHLFHDFIEKPKQGLAKILIDEGFLWNTAIYVYRLSDMMKEFHRFEPEMMSAADRDLYQMDARQFEESIIKRTHRLKIVEGFFDWDDIGTHQRLQRKRGEINGRTKDEINA